tara:strand:+ start:7007 stop:8941 length:1935 start_codon:yes stop_codon:yes gene_type:complete
LKKLSNFEIGKKIIKSIIPEINNKPGIYFMYNNKKEILYIGKAKNLNKRLKSYYNESNLSLRIQRMVSQISSIDYTITEHEASALLLEANMIKKYKPKFNILMRDDKSYPYILLRKDHNWPQIIKSRKNKNKSKGEYFGPFASVDAVHKTLNALQRVFPLRTCSDFEIINRKRPCLQYQIKRCSGPCTNKINQTEYYQIVDEVKSFLLGKNEKLQPKLQKQMESASTNLKYEVAANIRDRIRALNYIQKAEGADFRHIKDIDIFSIMSLSNENNKEYLQNENENYAIQISFYRSGKNFGNSAHFVKCEKNTTLGEILKSFIPQFYDNQIPPPIILVNNLPNEKALIEEALSIKSEKKIKIIKPIKGENKKALNISIKNAKISIAKKLSEYNTQNKLIKTLSKKLKLNFIPKRIEVFDNSHFSGSNMLGVMIVASQRGFLKGEYRKYNIKNNTEYFNPANDYGMMNEVFHRRFKKFNEINNNLNKPDLIIIDGGKGQCNIACKVLSKLNIKNIIVIGIAKGKNRNSRNEKIYFSSFKEYVPKSYHKNIMKLQPIKLENNDSEMYYIQRLRDEAHRFAITAQRKKQNKSLTNSILNNIDGIGPVRKKALILHFGSTKNISDAQLSELKKVKGISEKFALKIYSYFQ